MRDINNDSHDRPESVPGGGGETLCIASDGTARPMTDVLGDRAAQYRVRPKAEREASYRERCWLIACLQACTCSYPLVRAATETGHEAWCTAHRWQSNREAARSREESR